MDKAVEVDIKALELSAHNLQSETQELSPHTLQGDSPIENADNDTSSQSEESEWSPDSEESNEEELLDTEERAQSICNQKTYLVFESCLMSLFAFCSVCLKPLIKIQKSLSGSMLRVEADCIEGHKNIWFSQPMHNRMPWGNFSIAAACLFSGSQSSKVMTFLRHLNMAQISSSTYNAIQRAYLIPSINAVWEDSQRKYFDFIRGKNLVLGGDARMDSPGHSAKYGSYTLMDLERNKIIDTQLIQVTRTTICCFLFFFIIFMSDGEI